MRERGVGAARLAHFFFANANSIPTRKSLREYTEWKCLLYSFTTSCIYLPVFVSAGLAHINIDRMVIRVAHPRRSVTAGAGVQPELLECAVLLTVT